MSIRSLSCLPIVCLMFQADILLADEATGAPGAGTGRIQRSRVAVVLGGGGGHAVAHLGILQELERQRVPIDLIIGTGIGGVIGGLYASGMTLQEIQDFMSGHRLAPRVRPRYAP